ETTGLDMKANDLDALIEQSTTTDVQVLLNAKEQAKRQSLDDPSPANLNALERASKMLENAVNKSQNLKDYRAALAHITNELGRKIGKTKLYADISAGKLKKEADGSFKTRNVEKYAASLSMLGTPDALIERVADRARRKDEQEIRRIAAVADREEFTLQVKKGEFVPKSKVHLELAARAVTLSSGIKTSLEAHILDIVSAAGGDPKKATAVLERLESLLDEAFNDYSREMEFEVTFSDEARDSE
ncbi:MAG: hypothetical protein RRY29_11220, partial [Desulfovibrionaceae bacterium]